MTMRCTWVPENSDLYKEYHDKEWGTPVYDDQKLFEMLFLECFQAGLSWCSILKKREAFRLLFDGFDALKIAQYDEDKVAALMTRKEIIRNRLKIKAAISNARIFLAIQKEFGSFSSYLWGYVDGKTVVNAARGALTTSPLSDEISADLKSRGMKFVGSITIYSYLQAVGLINDHEKECFRFHELTMLSKM